jgi:membrane protein YdbS with pleckstrin-like domain|tara:strand:+ start:396 stop:863 length:468 start_codon:yes stop_codon:yes gene_type:complete
MIDSNGDYFCRVSRKIYWKVYLFLFVCAGFIVAGYGYGVPPGKEVLIGFGVTLAIGMKATEAHRLVHSYKITHHHLSHQHGLFSRKTKQVLLSSIGDFKVDQSFWQRVFNMGNIFIYHYGNDHAIEVINIGRPQEFAEFLQKKLLIAKGVMASAH